MITDYPWRQETRIIDDHDGYIEGFSEVFEDVFEVAYIARTCDDHAYIMMLDGGIDDRLSFPVCNREEESFFFI